MAKIKDHSGEVFGKLKILEHGGFRTQPNGNRYSVWLCQCKCGNKTKVIYGNLKKGLTTSCGCVHKKVTSEKNRTHGASGTPLYTIWAGMKQRCRDAKHVDYSRYGGRGIKVCERWLHSFANFASDMGDRPTSRHSIDRMDGDGDYSPDNCRWATPREQSRNTRRNRHYAYQDEKLTIPEYAEKYGVADSVIRNRIKNGHSMAEAIETPLNGFAANYFYNGESLTVRQLSTKYGINFQTFRHRLANGWNISDAIQIKDGRVEKRTSI